MIQLISPIDGSQLAPREGYLVDVSGHRFPVVNGIPRFVDAGHYATSFGLQWNRFRKTQLDTPDALTLSEARFFASTDWDGQDLSGQNILEVGSGAGRFSRVVLQRTGADLYSVDLSDAVDANLANNGPDDRLHLYQADIYALPFAAGTFDKVFGWWTKIQAKYLLRPLARHLSAARLLGLIERHVDWMLTASDRLQSCGLGLLGRFLPVANPTRALGPDATPERRREWAILDTFDMFSPTHDHPQRVSTVARWVEQAGVCVEYAGFVEYRAGLRTAVVRGLRT